MKHIFVIDDEKNIRDLIRKYLEKEGYTATLFECGENVLDSIDLLNPDLIVLDIMMEGISGIELCTKIRTKSQVPIIFVSARGEEFDRILGIEIGADDYLSKPFSPRELIVRIKNIFRRIDNASLSSDNNIIKVKDIKIDLDRRYVERDGEEIKFTTKEYDLFEFFAKNTKKPFSREMLIEKVWGYEYIGDERTIDDLVKRIRKKLKDINACLEITTVWGFGYRMDN